MESLLKEWFQVCFEGDLSSQRGRTRPLQEIRMTSTIREVGVIKANISLLMILFILKKVESKSNFT